MAGPNKLNRSPDLIAEIADFQSSRLLDRTSDLTTISHPFNHPGFDTEWLALTNQVAEIADQTLSVIPVCRKNGWP